MGIIEIITLVTVVLDVATTCFMAVMAGHLRSECCYGLMSVHHTETSEQIVRHKVTFNGKEVNEEESSAKNSENSE